MVGCEYGRECCGEPLREECEYGGVGGFGGEDAGVVECLEDEEPAVLRRHADAAAVGCAVFAVLCFAEVEGAGYLVAERDAAGWGGEPVREEDMRVEGDVGVGRCVVRFVGWLGDCFLDGDELHFHEEVDEDVCEWLAKVVSLGRAAEDDLEFEEEEFVVD